MSREMIKEHENIRLDVYEDSLGNKTVGYGHLIDADSPKDIRNLKLGEKISEKRAEEIFEEDYTYHLRAAKKIPGFSKASKSQKEALVDLTFNMGPSWYKNFPDFAEAFEDGNYAKAAEELVDSDWYSQVGRRAPIIVEMVKDESDPSVIPPDDLPASTSVADRIARRRLKADPKKIKDEYKVIPSSIADRIVARRIERAKGLGTEFVEGLTFGLAGEIQGAVDALTTDKTYSESRELYEAKRKAFKKKNPELNDEAFLLETVASLPTGTGLAAGLSRVGIKSLGKIGAIEAGGYGVASGNTFEERVQQGAVGALAGFSIGKVVQAATRPASIGGLKTQADDVANNASDIDDIAIQRGLEEEKFIEVDVPEYTQKPLSEAKTAGEFWGSAKTAIRKFYDDKITAVSDDIARRMPQVGLRFQRADETALRQINKDIGGFADQLIPVMRIINENERIKGALLDYGAGRLGKIDDAISFLRKDFSKHMSEENFNSLEKYLRYSARKNEELNQKVFGSIFQFPTYLHTRNNAFTKKLKDKGTSDRDVEEIVFTDRGREARNRGSYLESEGKTPIVSDYDNPLLSDMQRIFQMEKFGQVQRIFGVDIKNTLKIKREVVRSQRERAGAGEVVNDKQLDAIGITPTEFMDSFFNTLLQRGISNDGADYAVKKITDSIIGANSAPHPLIQAINSTAYATTLAGPLSAVLNIADIPLLGAKYGGRAVLEGFKALSPFKKIPDIDLQKAGLDNQVMGEFTNALNDEMRDGAQGFLKSLASRARKGTNLLMRGSGFAAMDQVGKKGVLRGVLSSAVDDAGAGRLADNWSFYFSKKELELIADQFKRHGADHTKYTGRGGELAEELMFAGLGQQQLISSAGRPAAWARNPNLRPLWALRGFVVKQQALALREVVGNIKAGRPEKAKEFLARYALYGAGGYAVINEGRQFVFGDGEISAGGLARGYGDAWASLLTANTLGLNDYQYGQIKQNGFIPTLILGSEPLATARTRDIISTAIEVIDQERPPQALLTEIFPAGKQVTGMFSNLAEATGDNQLKSVTDEILRKKNVNPN